MVRSLVIALRVAVLAAACFGSLQLACAQEAPAASIDLLAAEAAGQVEVRFIPNDSRSAQVVVANRDERPLTLRMPAAFAGVPVAAQMMGMGPGIGGQQTGFGGAQTVGGGGMQGPVGGPGQPGGAFGAGGGAFCWVAREVYGVHDPRWLAFREWLTWQAPAWLQSLYANHGEVAADWLRTRPAARAGLRLIMDQAIASAPAPAAAAQLRVMSNLSHTAPFTVPSGKSVTLRVPLVCLEYGRPEPTPRMTYRLSPLADFSQDPRLAVLLGGLASGHLTQPVAQAAAWHVASGRSWEQLAAEVVKGAGAFPDRPVFSPAELQAARQAVAIADRVSAAGRAPGGDSPASPGSRSASDR
ncbi:MAG: hypothetical protein RLZZ440_273 [Planctomycetota bacterium]